MKKLKIIAGIILIPGCFILHSDSKDDRFQTGRDWPVYGGNKAGNRYSPLRQVNRKNVNKLQVAWTLKM